MFLVIQLIQFIKFNIPKNNNNSYTLFTDSLRLLNYKKMS